MQDKPSRYRRRASSDDEDVQSDSKSRRSRGKLQKNRPARGDNELSDNAGKPKDAQS